MDPASAKKEPGDLGPLGHYELLEKLGEGGMGVVFRARDTRLGRFVALKVLPPDKVADPRRKQRFLREAMLASALNHPGIVTIHDVTSDQDRDFIVMELIEGKSLHDAIPEGGMEAARALSYAIEIASAMAAAHRAGIVHRDLKPHNVMVTEAGDGSFGRVKVLDFGIAKLSPVADPGDTTLTQLTGRGEIPGTLAYMSPEQLRGESVDHRSDIFSLGVMCYEMLTGRRPFQGSSAVDLAHEIYFTAPESVTRYRPDLPTAVSDAIARTLRKQRSERPSDMGELRDELASWLPQIAPDPTADEPTQDRLEGRRDPAVGAVPAPLESDDRSHTLFDLVTFDRRTRWLIAPLLTTLLLLSLALTPAFRHRVSEWIADRDGGQASPTAATLSTHEIYLQGLAWLERHYRPGNIDLAIESFQRVLARDRESAAAHAGLAKAYLRKYLNEGRDRSWRDQALANARRAIELNGDLAVARASLGLVLVDLKQFDEARLHLEQARIQDPFNVDAYRGLGKIHERAGELQEAESLYRHALTVRPEDRRLHDLLGRVLYRTGRYPQAEAAFRRSIELAPDAPYGHKNLAATYHMQGKFPQAADQLQRAIELQPTSGLYTNLGTLYFYQGLYQEALAAFEKALAFKGSSNSYRRWANLADAYRWTPDNEQRAKDAYLRAIQLLREELAAAPADPELRSLLALWLAKRGDHDSALAELATLEELGVKGGATGFRAAMAYEICGRRDAALQSLESALAAGYSFEEVRREPELRELRDDLRYHRLAMKLQSPSTSPTSGS